MTVREEQGNLKQTVYITSDRKRFRDRSEADVHEKYLGWAQKVQQLGIMFDWMYATNISGLWWMWWLH